LNDLQPPAGRFVQATGVRIHYRELGSGPPVILLHGTEPGADGWSTYGGNAPALAGSFRVIVPDLPQYGQSEKVVIESGRLTYLSAVLRSFMDELGLGRADIVGLSMGGQTALKIAVDAPDRVGKLVVAAGAPLTQGFLTPIPGEGSKLIMGYYKGTGPSLEKMRTFMHTLPYDSSFISDDMVQERYQASLDPESVRILSTTTPGREDLRDQLPGVSTRTLLIWGADDRFSPLDAGLQTFRLLPDARMLIFPRCGHWPHVEHRDEFNRVVLDFLRSDQ